MAGDGKLIGYYMYEEIGMTMPNSVCARFSFKYKRPETLEEWKRKYLERHKWRRLKKFGST